MLALMPGRDSFPASAPTSFPTTRSQSGDGGGISHTDIIIIAAVCGVVFLCGLAYIIRKSNLFQDCCKPREKSQQFSQLAEPLVDQSDVRLTELHVIERQSSAFISVPTDVPNNVEGPKFDPENGFAVNAPAERAIADCWKGDGENSTIYQLPYTILASATNEFSQDFKIGGGGSCLVYRGVVYGIPVAIKAIKKRDEVDGNSRLQELDNKQFHAEMKLLEEVGHPNICRLLAISFDGPQRCLVLELCGGGSLHDRLQKRPTQELPTLTWRQRLQIIVAIGRALAHLHLQTPPMIHRDVKTQNVLLQHANLEDMTATTKLADFGTVRADVRKPESMENPGKKTHATTRMVMGTGAYMPPEYVTLGHVSEKTDSFAYGIVLTEVVTGLLPHAARELQLNSAPACAASIEAHQGTRVHPWPSTTLRQLCQTIDLCTHLYAGQRSSIVAVMPQLEALLAANTFTNK